MSAGSTRSVAPILAPFVSGLHYYEATGAVEIQRVLPTARAHLLVNLDEDELRTYHGTDCAEVRRTSGAVLEGPASRSRVIDTGLCRSLVSVDFALGGAAAFFAMPVSEACDELVDLDQLWGADGAVLRERLLEAPTPAAALQVVETMLIDRLVCRDKPDPAIALAASLFERGASVSEVSARVGWLPKTLVRRFRSLVGLTPKRFSRVRRLQRATGAISDSSDVNWSALAAAHGYADQAHLVHEFRELADITPTAYQPRSFEERNHVPVRSA